MASVPAARRSVPCFSGERLDCAGGPGEQRWPRGSPGTGGHPRRSLADFPSGQQREPGRHRAGQELRRWDRAASPAALPFWGLGVSHSRNAQPGGPGLGHPPAGSFLRGLKGSCGLGGDGECGQGTSPLPELCQGAAGS